MNDSNAGQRHILVAVSGNTPQIVTETLYYLWVVEKIRIEAVYIITTRKGKEVAWKKLGGEDGAMARFCREYGSDAHCIAFTEDHIQVFTSKDGKPLEDIRSTEDNYCVRAQLLGFIEKLTDDDQQTLHCTMGGGRRTMSAHMLLALTLYGREQDRLTHILVKEEFEDRKDFFFPPRRSEPFAVVRDAEGKARVLETKEHDLQLADIPVIRLRSLVGEDHQMFKDIEDLLKHLQNKINNLPPPAPPELLVDLQRGVIEFNGAKIPLSPFQAALFAYYAETKALHCRVNEALPVDENTDCYQAARDFEARRFLKLYQNLAKGLRWMNSQAKLEKEWLETPAGNAKEKRDAREKRVKRLQSERRKINMVVESISPLLKIVSVKEKEQIYGLRLPKKFIRIIDNAKPAANS